MPTGSLFTSATAPSNSAKSLYPDLDAQQAQINRQQQMADILRQQSLTPMGPTDVIGGWAVKRSPMEGLAKMAQALAAGSAQPDIDKKNLALAKLLQERKGDAFNVMAGGAPSSAAPAQPAPPMSASPDQSVPSAPPTLAAPPDGAQTFPVDGAPPAGQSTQPQGVASTTMPMPAQPPAAAPQMTQADRIRNQAKAAYMMGNTELANKLLENISTMTEGQRNDAYLGISADQSRTAELAKRAKEGYIAPTSLRGQAYMTPDGKISTLPDAAQPGYMNKLDQATGQWSTVPVQGGIDSVKESAKAVALGKTLGTLNQGVDDQQRPTYFLGLPPGTIGAPPGGQGQPQPTFMPSAPSPSQAPAPAQAPPQQGAGAPVDLNHMSPDMRKKVMANAEALGNLRPGSTPGTSVIGSTPAAPPPASTGMIRPGNAPGQNEFMKTTAEAAGKRVNDLITTASESPTRINVLDNIIGLSKSGVDSGPNAGWVNSVKGVMASVPGFSGWKNDVTGFQEMNKYLKQNGLRAWQAAGGSGTDSQLSAAMEANPNSKMFPKAVQDMANWAKAGELALQGKANATQQSGGSTPQDQAKFETLWRQNMDPRIYQMKMGGPDALKIATDLKKNDPTGYAELLKKAQILHQLGGL